MADSAAACTIVARNYLPAARVLAVSYLRHHPDATFVVLLVDALTNELAGELVDGLADTAARPRLFGPDDLDLDPAEFRRMATAYTVTELCTAVKPWLLTRLLRDHDTVTYLDPDIAVFAPFPEVAELAAEHGIVLTPHVLRPMPRDGLRPSEADIMASGVFNLGFIAVSRDAAAFLDFWAERLRQDAISAPAEQLFTDQRWVDNVPALFRHTVVTDPGFNVAYWNAYQRPLDRDGDGVLTAAGQPLRFYHFSGYRPEKPWLLSTHCTDKPRVLLSENPVLARLCADYRRELLEAGYAETLESVPYRWNDLPDGTRLPPSLRRMFRQAWVRAEKRGEDPPPTPFDDVAPGAFLDWATGPADGGQASAGMNRWAISVWQARADLRQAFGDPLGADAEAFRQWCATSGVREGELHPMAVPTGPRPSAVAAVEDTAGVNLLGYLTAELGVGEMGRLVHDAVRASRLPFATVVEEEMVGNRTRHPLPDGAAVGAPRFPVSVLCVNADMTPAMLRRYPQLADDRYVIGMWSWELAEFPEWMRGAFELVDEVWTISEFCRASIAAHSPVPVHTFPVPVPDPLGGVEPPLRNSSQRATRFLFVFDHHSVLARKNPVGLVRAFQQAFPGAEDVELVIKSINGAEHAADQERLRAAVAGDQRIELAESYLDRDDVRALFASVDCYVSPHRSEGFGLTVAEAMAHGLPVIATGYSGTAEFLTEDTGWVLPYRMVPVGPGQHPYPPTAVWAEPDLEAAARAMREVAADPAGARVRGLAARRHVLSTRTAAEASRWVAERVGAAHEGWRRTRTLGKAHGDAPLAPLASAREALRWRADASTPSRIPLAPVLRRGVLRVLDHYDQHQRRVLCTLMDGMQHTAEGLDRRLAGVERQAGPLGLQRDLQRTREQITAEAEERFSQAEAFVRRLDEIEQRLAAAGQRSDDVDHRLVTMLRERDARLERVERASADLRRWVQAVRTGLQRHHDLLDPPSEFEHTEAVPTDVGILRLPSSDTVVLPWLRNYATWEEQESQLIDELLGPGDTFVDIGAHVGYYTLRALRRTGADGAVFAVEPWQLLGELLARNVRANVPEALAKTLTVLAVAAWDAAGQLTLATAQDGNTGDNRITQDGPIAVAGVRLDSVVELRSRRLTVVKSDVQGRDHRALAGLSELLLRDHPHVVCEFWPAGIEEFGDDPGDVLGQYRDWGYEFRPVRRRHDDGALSDRALIDAAVAADGGFLTLWLRPVEKAGP